MRKHHVKCCQHIARASNLKITSTQPHQCKIKILSYSFSSWGTLWECSPLWVWVAAIFSSSNPGYSFLWTGYTCYDDNDNNANPGYCWLGYQLNFFNRPAHQSWATKGATTYLPDRSMRSLWGSDFRQSNYGVKTSYTTQGWSNWRRKEFLLIYFPI